MTEFVALIPARLASTRLPDKPLADIGGLPMVVRVAQQARQAAARAVVIATDSQRIADAAEAAGISVVITRNDHPSGTDRLAEAAGLLGLRDDEIVVNVQGDEPQIPPALIAQVAELLATRTDCVMATAGHPIASSEEFASPNVVKLVCDARSRALYFSRAPIPFERDARTPMPTAGMLESGWPLRHIGLYAYRVSFLKRFPRLERSPLEQLESLEQLRVLWHGHGIAVHRAMQAPPAGVDTPEDLERVRRAFNFPTD